MKLDLGLRGDLSVASSLMDQISPKSLVASMPMYGFLGKVYPTNFYRISKIKVGRVTFVQPIMQEKSEESQKDSIVIQDDNNSDVSEPGMLGWKLFQKVNLLVDIKNERVAFCDSLDTLAKEGYLVEHFAKAPLLTERGLIEVEVKTGKDLLRCVLDTGSTWNIFNAEIEDGKRIEEVLLDPSNIVEYESFKIGTQEFGPIPFHQMPIRLPIHLDAILGMEFFENHIVFLDFSEKLVYFFKNQKTSK